MSPVIAEPKRVSLFYREGSSDKEYHAHIEPKGDGFVVNFAYGRRGSTLQTGTKTSSNPVDYDAALAVLDKLVKEKKAKGYSEALNGSPYQHSDKAGQKTNLLPQLLNANDEHQVIQLIEDPAWCMQEKMDGKRVLLRKENGTIEGINRKGLVIGLPQSIITSVEAIPGDFVFDGECIGEVLHVFDLLFVNGKDIRTKPYRNRYVDLFNVMAKGLPKHIHILPSYADSLDKAKWLKLYKDRKAEGVVFKQWGAPYTAGRPNSGGTQLKHKFYATLSAVVGYVNRQRSVSLRLLNQDGWQSVGNVTIPANQRIPKVGAVVEVRYLYAYKDGCMFQPVYQGERKDIGQEECVMSQLKYKADGEDES